MCVCVCNVDKCAHGYIRKLRTCWGAGPGGVHATRVCCQTICPARASCRVCVMCGVLASICTRRHRCRCLLCVCVCVCIRENICVCARDQSASAARFSAHSNSWSSSRTPWFPALPGAHHLSPWWWWWKKMNEKNVHCTQWSVGVSVRVFYVHLNQEKQDFFFNVPHRTTVAKLQVNTHTARHTPYYR